MMTATRWVSGIACWAPDEDRAFVEATVQEESGSKCVIKVVGRDGVSESRTVDASELLPRSVEQRVFAEMDELQELHQASVLNNLELLFGQPQCDRPGEGPTVIYSSVGPTLIAMNPFVQLPIYGEEWIRAYREASGDPRRNKELGPHCYRTVEEAYGRLRSVKRQSVVICGESGAGKTVTARKMIEYLCTVARKPAKGKAKGGTHQEQIVQANIMLEAFGNAKTARNDNSSRFGKYTKLTFDPAGDYTICGCHVDHYLLERSRVVSHVKTERSYHIFYQLLGSGEGAAFELRGSAEDFVYTRQSATMSGPTDAEAFRSLVEEMTQAGFDEETRTHIFRGVAAVLHLGNVDFTADADSCQVHPSTMPALERACRMLGINAKELGNAMTSRLLKGPGKEMIKTNVGADVARGQRDTVAKTMYARLFDYIVSTISYRLKRTHPGPGAGGHGEAPEAVIGLLDIFGFEDLTVNGFEQMFINLTNERIQQLFNSIMFDRELEAYKKEGITTAFNPDVENIECVRLFTSPANPPGIVKLLGESVLMKNGRDGASLVQVLNSTCATHPNFRVCDPGQALAASKKKGLKSDGRSGGYGLDYRECFLVNHYAGEVIYTVDGWVPKSIDGLSKHLSDVLRSSTESQVKELFEQEETMGNETVGKKFCTQLESLASTLETGETLFVRCIKSNPQMISGMVNRKEVLGQLVHGGVINALKMRHKGLPDRMSYEAFCFEYSGLENKKQWKKDYRVRCERLLREIFDDEAEQEQHFAFGLTKVFMKSHVNAFLRGINALRTRNVVKNVQRQWRVHTGRERIRKVEEALEQYREIERLAKTRGVDKVRSVAEALKEAWAAIEPMTKLLEELRQKHGTDAFKIGKALHPDKMSPLFNVTETLKSKVDVVVQRKNEEMRQKHGTDAFKNVTETLKSKVDVVVQRKNKAEKVLNQYLARVVQDSVTWRERVVMISGACDELSDVASPDMLKECLAACAAAIARLDKLQNENLPELRRLGLVGVDLDSADEDSLDAKSISPKANEFLKEAKALVDKAEQLANEVFRVRRDFQQAVQDVQGQQEEAMRALEALSGSAQRCIAEGLSDVVAKVGIAWQKQVEAQHLLQAAKDADGYRASVEALVNCVREASETFERGREQLERREQEKEARLALQEQLDSLRKDLEESRASIRRNTEVRIRNATEEDPIVVNAADIDLLLEEIPALRGSQKDLDEWEAQVEAVSSRTKATLQVLQEIFAADRKMSQQEFAKRAQVFSSAPDTPKGSKLNDEALSSIAFIQMEGLADHEEALMQIQRTLETLHEAGVHRSAVQRCLNRFVKTAWGCGGSGRNSITPLCRTSGLES